MGNVYEIYALRYATMSPRTPHMNFLAPDPHMLIGQRRMMSAGMWDRFVATQFERPTT